MGLRMRTFFGPAIALATLATLTLDPHLASADSFRATRSDKLVEKSHKIDIQLGHGYADLRVRRTVHNGGPRHDQATFYIDMPSGAVAVGLRTLGMLEGKPHWFAGELLEAEAAAAKYRELTGIGGYYPKDPALLSWRSQDRLALQVFPCAPGEDKTIEYTLRIPTQYRDGRHHLDLPAMGTQLLHAEASVWPMHSGETVYVADKPVAAPGWVRLKDQVDLSVAPITTSSLDGALASVPINPEKNLVHYHIEAAPRLGTVPAGAHVVVLVDASRSLKEHETTAALAMARAYASHFPGGRIAIVPFDRKVHVPKAGFVSVGQARTTLKTMTIEQQNGSHVDEALARADVMLAAAPSSAPKRILLLTDTRTRAEVTPEMLKSKLQKSGALLHVSTLSSSNQSWVAREDDHEWNAVTRPSGGLVWSASIDTDDTKRNETVFEEWARPKRIDHLSVRPRGIAPEELSFPTVLEEGQGLEDLRLPKIAVDSVEVTGELWATPIRKVFTRDDAEGQRWAGLFFGTNLYNDITEAEMMPLAMLGKVVSPVTSYLAIEPGVRPSTEGLDEGEGSGFGFGSGSGGLAGGRFMGAGIMNPVDKEKFLREKLENGLAKCGGKGRKASATIETTIAEIVAVKASIDGEKAGSALVGCFEESAWDIYLPGVFHAAHEVFTVTL